MAHYAPAGTPVSLLDILGGLSAAPRSSREALDHALRQIAAVPNVWPVSSGRAAMVLILRAMKAAARDPQRDEVIVPAYTCYSVPAAIELAGLKPRLCDVDPATLGPDLSALERCNFSRTLTVVSSNLYGLPNELGAIEALCRQRGVYFLDDAAQSLGAKLGTRAVGTFGDAGLYSFDKGKIICTMQGGAIVCRDGALATELAKQVGSLPASAPAETLRNFIKLSIYSVFLRPSLYGLINRLPFAPVGRTPYETTYPLAQLSGFQTGVAARLATRIDTLNAGRRLQGEQLAAVLGEFPQFQTPLAVPGSSAVYARYPALLRNPDQRDVVIAALLRAGIGATASYPQALCDVPEVFPKLPADERDFPAARRVARSILTLPTHAYCPPDLAQRVRQVLRATFP